MNIGSTLSTVVQIVILAHILYTSYVYLHNSDESRKQYVFQQLSSDTQLHSNSSLKVAVGYNSNLDLICSALNLLNKLRNSTVSKLQDRDHAVIHTMEQLEECFAYFFKSGGAAERIVMDKQLFNSLVTAGMSLEEKTLFVGGNAALLAQIFAKSGCSVLLAGALGPKLKSLLAPLNMEYANSVGSDEVHLIMEYKSGDEFNGFKSPRANRFIVTRDIYNSEFQALDEFHEKMNRFAPKLLVLSGFHLLDGQQVEIRRKMLQKIASKLHNQTAKFVHVEIASVGQKDLYVDVGKFIFPYIDSIGLNEQELGDFFFELTHQKHEISQKVPHLPDVKKAIFHLFSNFPQLSRIHFHSLAFHLLVQKQNSKWSKFEGLKSVAAGSIATTKSACELENTELLVDKDLHEWKEDGFDFYYAPVLVCKHPQKTVGLGDTISASALMRQLVNA